MVELTCDAVLVAFAITSPPGCPLVGFMGDPRSWHRASMECGRLLAAERLTQGAMALRRDPTTPDFLLLPPIFWFPALSSASRIAGAPASSSSSNHLPLHRKRSPSGTPSLPRASQPTPCHVRPPPLLLRSLDARQPRAGPTSAASISGWIRKRTEEEGKGRPVAQCCCGSVFLDPEKGQRGTIQVESTQKSWGCGRGRRDRERRELEVSTDHASARQNISSQTFI